MNSRQLLAVSTAGMAVALAQPAAAQPEMTYEGSGYEYAIPAPVAQAPIIYQRQPVVQPIAATQEYEYETEYEYEGDAGADYQYEGSPYPVTQHAAPIHHAYPTQQHYQPQAFDRDAWLEQCRSNMRSQRRGGDGAVTGGLLGAVAGGVIGNRVADGDRLAGTLIGAGVGGIAGAAVGSAIESGNRRSEEREYCEAYLDQYQGGGYGYHGAYPMGGYHHGQAFYGYAYAYQPVPVMYVQVMVPVERRAVVREYVEYVNEPVTVVEEVQVEEVVRHRVMESAPTKTIPVKRASQPTKYIKND